MKVRVVLIIVVGLLAMVASSILMYLVKAPRILSVVAGAFIALLGLRFARGD